MAEQKHQLILIVDDDAADRAMIQLLLARLPESPYACIEASTCDTALELCRRQKPDCMLLDYSMPDMDGIMFIKKLRQDGFQYLPIVLVTAYGSEMLAVEALKTGAHDYVRKDKLSSDVLAHAVKFAVYQKQSEQALLQRDLDLAAKNEELTRFNYMVSHNLKSPLVTIQTFLNYLEEHIRTRDAAGIEADLGYIRTAADKMALLIKDLLNLSQLDDTAIIKTEIPLRDIVQEVLALVAGRVEQIGARVQVVQEPIKLYGDQVRMVAVFLNLIDNALKFMGSQSKPFVEIGVKQKNGQTVYYVRDNGMGIDPRHRDKIFGLFERLDANTEGTGIGLALVKRILEAHGGRIWMESEGLGKGACVWFSLPGK